jgi:hypothetical protein
LKGQEAYGGGYTATAAAQNGHHQPKGREREFPHVLAAVFFAVEQKNLAINPGEKT